MPVCDFDPCVTVVGRLYSFHKDVETSEAQKLTTAMQEVYCDKGLKYTCTSHSRKFNKYRARQSNKASGSIDVVLPTSEHCYFGEKE